jgi:hypothetical protein
MGHYNLNKEHIVNEVHQTLKNNNLIDVMKMKKFEFKVRAPIQKYSYHNSEINAGKDNFP